MQLGGLVAHMTCSMLYAPLVTTLTRGLIMGHGHNKNLICISQDQAIHEKHHKFTQRLPINGTANRRDNSNNRKMIQKVIQV
jgi:hypothetical protein